MSESSKLGEEQERCGKIYQTSAYTTEVCRRREGHAGYHHAIPAGEAVAEPSREQESPMDEAKRLTRAFTADRWDEMALCGQFLRMIESRDQARADVRAHEETAKELLRAKDEREKHWWTESQRLAGLIQEYEPKARRVAQLEREIAEKDEKIASYDGSPEDYERTIALHADLNRRAAKALGKPFEGEGSSWHDIPECITDLTERMARAEHERDEAEGFKDCEGEACGACLKCLGIMHADELRKRAKAEKEAHALKEALDAETARRKWVCENDAFVGIQGPPAWPGPTARVVLMDHNGAAQGWGLTEPLAGRDADYVLCRLLDRAIANEALLSAGEHEQEGR